MENQITDTLLQLAVENGLVQEASLGDILEEHQQSGKPFRSILIDMQLVTEDALLELVAGYLGTSVVSLPSLEIAADVIHSVPASVARMHNVVPVERGPNSVVLATSDLLSPELTDELQFVLSRDLSFVMARDEDVKSLLSQFYGDSSEAMSDILSSLQDDLMDGGGIEIGNATDDKELEEAAASAPVVKFVNAVLYQAVSDRASDIHFEPFEKEFQIRYRIDGALYAMSPPPKRLAMPVISRIKVLSNLDIAERRLPQDGRIQMTIGGRVIDLRVSTLPTQFGESVVLRVLDRGAAQLDIENLGMPEDVYETYGRDIAKPNGIIIITGPTGSGKTTTLYSGLRRINTPDVKILTAEQPVEYEIEGLVQVPVDEKVGNTFARTLRAFLRQDPDVIMIGEIRDQETAEIAIQASLTGHLVFTTLHTNDSAGAVTRLVDMGIEPFLISSTIEAVLAQRLVRTICSQCKRGFHPDADMLARLSMMPGDIEGREFFHGEGCQTCENIGYKGRKGLYEYLSITEPIRELINDRQPTLIIRSRAVELGMRTLRQDGIRNVLDGYTTVEEILKYT